jgi:hypothetical protein
MSSRVLEFKSKLEKARETIESKWKENIDAVARTTSPTILQQTFPLYDALRNAPIGKFQEMLVARAFEEIKKPKYIEKFCELSEIGDEVEKNKAVEKIVQELQEDMQLPKEGRNVNGMFRPIEVVVRTVNILKDDLAPVYRAYKELASLEKELRDLEPPAT